MAREACPPRSINSQGCFLSCYTYHELNLMNWIFNKKNIDLLTVEKISYLKLVNSCLMHKTVRSIYQFSDNGYFGPKCLIWNQLYATYYFVDCWSSCIMLGLENDILCLLNFIFNLHWSICLAVSLEDIVLLKPFLSVSMWYKMRLGLAVSTVSLCS